MAAAAAGLINREIMKRVAYFIGKILASLGVMGIMGVANQYLSGQLRDIGKGVMSMIGMLYRSFKNRNS